MNRTFPFSLLPSSCRKGSALLIVLGMLSFMVVSAVGFSIYMRTNRAPSSYLRRNIAARYLVRAALAKAVEELEGEFNDDRSWGKVASGGTDTPRKFYGVYDDPFPGVVLNDSAARSNPLQNGDYWLGRVFAPFGLVSSTDATVSTLTLESLAYLPPAIIDDVRRLSRLTRTACWRSLPYDSGRYAYCAVNVSDLFDINKLRANMPRNSGRDRITLASLCPSSFDDMMNLSDANAKTLDNILETSVAQYTTTSERGKLYGNAVPFTSLADFNFLVGNSSDYAPFMGFIGTSETGPLASKIGSVQTGNAMFITDTWFPPADVAAGETVYDLGSNAQPFMENGFDADSFLNTLLKLNPATSELYTKNLGIGVAALYDYLDSDNKPISLVLPTVEAVPMIVGVSAPAGLAPQLDNIGATVDSQVQNLTGTATDNSSGVPATVPVTTIVANRKCQLFGITSFGNQAIVLQVVATSPFKRLAATNRAKTYNVRGLLRVWLAPDGMGCRPNVMDNLYPTQADWQDGVKNGVATFLSDTKPLSQFASDVKTTGDAVTEATLRFSNLNVEMPLYYNVEEEVDQNASKEKNPTLSNFNADSSNFKASYTSFGDIKNNAKVLCPLTVNGEVDRDWRAKVDASQFNTTQPYAVGGGGVTEFDPASTPIPATGDYRLYAAIWVQVLDGSQVVDMVPARVNDDVEWLRMNLPNPDSNAYDNWCGSGAPLLNFKSDNPITYETIATTLVQSPSFSAWKALYAVDPRYNFAPEDWFSSTASDLASKSEWMQLLGLNGASSPILGQGGRDHDIFMFVSDQEYLQSIGELQFLPILEDMDGGGSFNSGGYSPSFNGQPFSQRTGPTAGNFANGGRFWKTYSAFPVGGVNDTNFKNPYKMQLNGKTVTVLSGTGGFKLNPFSRDDRVITAALIGTPFDYYVASTNDSQTQSGGRPNNLAGNITLSQMMSTYSFGNSSLAKLSKEELIEIAGEIKDTFEDSAINGNVDWLSAWDDLMWQENVNSKINDENKTFMDTDITLSDPLHGVDRKYLYSFWRECFDNRQQLFLIFVRAEPTSVGGGSLSRASTQLGGRAVALVWRDPAKPEKNKSSRPSRTEINSKDDFLNKRGNEQFPPHRTRVLFYHQFD